MKYISVTSPGSDMSKPIFQYFENYLVSLGEPITSPAWNNEKLDKHIKKMISEKPSDNGLYIDSGGFQIIIGYIEPYRIKDYINAYHRILVKNKAKIDTIFALDVFSIDMFPKISQGFSAEGDNRIPVIPEKFDKKNPILNELFELNKYSMYMSICQIKRYPEIKDKQIFILQSSNSLTFEIWRELFLYLNVYKYYKRWSIGGLVGLKKKNNSKFSHAVPATLWLLTYQKHFQTKNQEFEIQQMHWLGQSSRLSFISMSIFEKAYGIEMTSDSSQLVRFAPIEAKLPYLIKHDNDYKLIRTIDEMKEYMFPRLSTDNNTCYIKKNRKGDFEIVKNQNSKYVAKYTKQSFDEFKPYAMIKDLIDLNNNDFKKYLRSLHESDDIYNDYQDYIKIKKNNQIHIHNKLEITKLEKVFRRKKDNKLLNKINLLKQQLETIQPYANDDPEIAFFNKLKQSNLLPVKAYVKQSHKLEMELNNSIKSTVLWKLTPLEYYELTGQIDNQTFIDLQSQNLNADLEFGKHVTNLMLNKQLENDDLTLDQLTDPESYFKKHLLTYENEEQIKSLHPILEHGRIGKELFNNIRIFQNFHYIVTTGDITSADSFMRNLTDQYIKDNNERAIKAKALLEKKKK